MRRCGARVASVIYHGTLETEVWLHVPVVPTSRVIPFFRLGETASEFTNVTGADQVVHGEVIAWRHRPIIAGDMSAPDQPPRIPAPEPLNLGIAVAATVPGVQRL